MEKMIRQRAVFGMILAVVLVACSKPQGEHKTTEAEAEYYHVASKVDAIFARNSDSVFVFLDSIAATAQYPDYVINYLRGNCYALRSSYRLAELHLRKAICKELHDEWPRAYYQGINNLGVTLLNITNQEEALKVSAAGYEELSKESDQRLKVWEPSLLYVIGDCQLQLKQKDEGDKTMQQCYDLLMGIADTDTTLVTLEQIGNTCTNIAISYCDVSPEAAMPWIERAEKSLDMVVEHNKTSKQPTQEPVTRAKLQIMKAVSYAANGQLKEAREVYDTFMASPYANHPLLLIERLRYLDQTDQWDAAANLMPTVEEHVGGRDQYTMDNLSFIAESYHIYDKAGRTAEATKVARQVTQMVDSVKVHEQKSEAAELAVIYATQQKDQEIAEQRASLLHQRLIGLIVAIVLITLFFIIYTLYRRRVAHRMAEMKASQERIENELKIARDIQMSMVPSSFPEREGLDMSAYMMPAREVGGDLYGYVLIGQWLYFCVGDVSGKGVPASLFMAQATRLFRTLAAQRMEPAEICTGMNDALSGEDNVNNMFVTMFVGMLNLETGHLRFCNAGHNPPVIGGGDHHGDFLKMAPNTPIGVFPGLKYTGEEIDTIKGRPLFVYTDGLNEAEDTELRQFGDDRLLDILRHTHFGSAKQVIETLTTAVEKHRGGAEPNDDLTMLCLRLG